MKITKILLSIFFSAIILWSTIQTACSSELTEEVERSIPPEGTLLCELVSADIVQGPAINSYIKVGETSSAEIYQRVNGLEIEESIKETASQDVVEEKEISFQTIFTDATNLDIDFLAKLLYAESGSASWDCQVWCCSAILNLSDYLGRSVEELGHDYDAFSVAYYVDNITPSSRMYEVIDFVLNGNRIADVKYFRLYNPHSFGRYMDVCIDGVYFSK